jgi:membrane-bound lytic murein transglycosylase F
MGISRDRGRIVGRDRRISRYDHLIAKHAQQAGFDWRLVAAVIFRESRFDPHAVSRRGARGLMQVMPGTATDVGVPNARGAEASIQAGVAYLRRLSETFQESGGDDHLAIVLAAYLLGPGHVHDAQQIAHSLDLHTNLWWGGLKHVLPLLENPAFYNHTKFGFAPGHHAIRYVEQIFKRYNLYRRHADEKPVESAKTSRKDKGSA